MKTRKTRYFQTIVGQGLFFLILMTAMLFFSPSRSEAAAYVYQNDQYGFTIECPVKPEGVITLNKPEEQGVLIVFEGDNENVTYGWVILQDAFTEKDMPNLRKMEPQDLDAYTKMLVKSAGNESAKVIAVGEDQALYTISKEEPKVATAYIQAKKSFMVSLIAPADKFSAKEKDFQQGVVTFKAK